MLFLVVSLLLAGSWVIKIPDVKKASISVTSLQPPVHIEARTDGKVVQLFVADNETVQADDVLAVIENPASYQDVMRLKQFLSGFQLQNDSLNFVSLPGTVGADLGMIQSDYAEFYKNYRDYVDFMELDYHQRKIQLLNQEFIQFQNYSRSLSTRASIIREEYILSDKQYKRDSILFLQGVMAESSFEDTKSKMLSKRGNWQEIRSLIAENEIKIAGIREQILELELKQQEQVSSLKTSLEESLNKLKGSLSTWEKLYLIETPIAGQVTFNKIWSENQNVKAGEQVVTVIPSESSELLGKIRLPLKGAGEVKEDQPVNIRFENFPYMEYGMVKGLVSNVSKVPQDDYYTVEVTLPNGLTTYYGYDIEFSQNMQGQAEIITDKMRLLERILNPIRNAISRQREM